MAPTVEEPEPKTCGRGRPRGSSRSEEARSNSSRNARQSGLFAKTWALPHESEALARRAVEWHGFYKPMSPAACHLVNKCARAAVQTDRADAFERATLEVQARNCRQNWNRRRRRRVTGLTRKLKSDPRAAAEELKSFAFGLVWIIGLYREMIETARQRGYLLPDELDAVIWVWGISPEDKVIRRYEIPYLIQVYNLGATPGVAPALLGEWLMPANRPVELRAQAREEVLPETPADCTTLLVAVLEGQAEAYLLKEERLRTEVDAPDLQECLARAGVLYDADGGRVGRSKAEAKSSYHRAHKALFETLKRDAEEAEEAGEEPQPPSPEERVATVAAEATPGSQNENPAKAEPSPQVSEIPAGSGDASAAEEARPSCDQEASEEGARPTAAATAGVIPDPGGLPAGPGAVVLAVVPQPLIASEAGTPPPVALAAGSP